MNALTIKDYVNIVGVQSMEGKKVVVRADLNCPLDASGKVTDISRLIASLPTILYLTEELHAKVIIASHFGRPKGEYNAEFSLLPVAAKLSEVLGHMVMFPGEVFGDNTKKLISKMKKGNVLMLENLRFEPGEEANNSGFAQLLAGLSDGLLVNDAFGMVHRPAASTKGVANYIPCVAGLLLEKEINSLQKVLKSPAEPVVAVLGGGPKISEKIQVIEKLMETVACFIFGGAMANTFLKAVYGNIGNSIYQPEKLEVAKKILEIAKAKGIEICLPTDVRVVMQDGKEYYGCHEILIVPCDCIPDGCYIVDIGFQSMLTFESKIKSGKTIVWNGPMGKYEVPPFNIGTQSVARAIAASNAFSIVGGGHSNDAVRKLGLQDKFGCVSTGGGAMLQYFKGANLPGIDCLWDAKKFLMWSTLQM